MATLTRDERIAAARERTKRGIDSKDSFGVKGKQILDYEKIGGWKKELFYRPLVGMNHIDFIPYLVESDRHPQKVKPGYPDYILDVWTHRFVGASKSSFICLTQMYGKPCPICEAREKLKLDPDATKKEINKLYPKRRCWYNVINLDSKVPNQPVQIFEESHFLFEAKFLTVVNNKNEFDFWDIEEGKSIEFMTTEVKSPEGNHMDYGQFYFEKRQPYGEDIYKEAYNLVELLYIPTYEEVKAAYFDLDEEEVAEKPAENTRSERSRGVVPEETPSRSRGRNELEEIAEEKDHFKEEAPARTRERTRPATEEANKCPYGHKFGVDSEKFQSDCTKCDEKIWNECADEHDRLAGA